jgi:hypothetical protein
MSESLPYFATTPGHMLCPSFKGTMKGRVPQSSVPTFSLAQTTATQGVPAGIVGGINLDNESSECTRRRGVTAGILLTSQHWEKAC